MPSAAPVRDGVRTHPPARTRTLRMAACLPCLPCLLVAACVSLPAYAQAPMPRHGKREKVISIIGTNDVHGHIESLPMLGGYLHILRKKNKVVVLDAGDMFQGTVESNLTEGAAVVDMYNTLGMRAVAIGNHEFDFGPVGPAATPRSPDDDPQGALKARAAQARFPFLSANVRANSTTGAEGEHAPVAWKNVHPSALIRVLGIPIGIVGATTEGTPNMTLAANLQGVRITPIVEAVRAEAATLRAKGAKLVILLAHAGGECHRFDAPQDTRSCSTREELVRVLGQLPKGTVDLAVGGHTHAGMAHVIHGVPVIESMAYGKAFGRIDVRVDISSKQILGMEVLPPRYFCTHKKEVDAQCDPGTYEGETVVRHPALQDKLAKYQKRFEGERTRALGVQVSARFRRDYDAESALGNLLTDAMRASEPETTRPDVALMNGGGIRTDLTAGALIFEDVYKVHPFDNTIVRVRLTGKQLKQVLKTNLTRSDGFLSVSGARLQARCESGQLHVDLRRTTGEPIDDDTPLTVLTSDFLVSGGNMVFRGIDLEQRMTPDPAGKLIRDAIIEGLQTYREPLSPKDPRFFDPRNLRVQYPGKRPVRCAAPNTK
jgi:2',3'-cyclic-nucleotide 2'-phosphodiesterase (5'-nucleotidase family)